LSGSWGLLGRSGGGLGGSWCLLGCSWGPLGALLGGLGASWASLRPTWRRPKHHKDNMQKKSNFRTPQRRIMSSLGEVLGGQNRPKMAPKTSQNLRRISKAKKLLFKSVLEPSWADLGPKKHVPKPTVTVRTADLQKKARETNFVSNLSNLAAKMAKNDPNMAPQDDPKSTQNRCQKMIEILIEKKVLRVHFLGRPGGMRWPPGGIIGGAKNSAF
jgi:hypothetical protein